jgi:predicted ribosomally synthesized peptide with SipW-like signal peptide
LVNKKIILSILIIGCIATVAGAGTWAYYTSSATDSAKFTSGNLHVAVTTQLKDYGNIAPGWSAEGEPSVVVTNDGDMAIAKTDITFKLNGDGHELAKNLRYKELIVNGDTISSDGNIYDLTEKIKTYTLTKQIDPKSTINVVFKGLRMPEEATGGNGQNIELGIDFTGYQKT